LYNDQFEVKDKDPAFVYRWCNADDRAMLRHKGNGYEPVMGDPELPTQTAPVEGAGVLRRRGTDLILCRIPREVHERTIEARRRELRAQHSNAVDSAIDQANESAEASVYNRTQRHTKGLVFRTEAGPFKKE
jgi:hypothetical protein